MIGRAEPAGATPCRLAALAAAGLSLAAGAAGQPLQEALTVREVAVLVVPPAEQARWPGARRAGGIQVFEDDAPRRVTRVEDLADAGEDGAPGWQVVLYWDAELAGPDVGRAAARLLARHADRITQLGEATLIASAEAPRVVVAATRDPARLATALDELAGATLSGSSPAAAPPPITGAALGRRSAALLDRLARMPAATPRLLLLPLRGFVLGPAAMNALAGTPPPADLGVDEREKLAVIDRLGRELAAAGWVLLPIALADDSEAFRTAAADAHDRWRDSLPVQPPAGGIVLFRFPRRRPGRGTGAIDIDAALDLRLGPLRHLASATTGRTITRDSQLAGVLAELGSRWLVWYEAPPLAAGAPARRLAVRLAHDGRPLAAPGWRR